MGKVISMRLSDAEEARVRGAAALTGLSTSAYLKWLLINGKSAGAGDDIVLRRLEEIGSAISRLSADPRPAGAPSATRGPQRAAIVRGLKDRGVPSSTIRQVEAVLDDVAKTSQAQG